MHRDIWYRLIYPVRGYRLCWLQRLAQQNLIALNIAFNGAETGHGVKVGTIDDTRTQMVRVLIVMIFTFCAAGVKPACSAYTVFSESQKPVIMDDYWLMRDLEQVLPFVGWNTILITQALAKYKKLHPRII